MLKNNLIDFVSDSVTGQAVRIATFLGRELIVDDGLPVTSGVFDTWLFGAGAVRAGSGAAATTAVGQAARSGHFIGQAPVAYPAGCTDFCGERCELRDDDLVWVAGAVRDRRRSSGPTEQDGPQGG